MNSKTGNSLPTISLTAPTVTQYTAPATINISAQASDTDGTVSKVEFYSNTSTLLGTVTTAPYNFTWTNVPAGGYDIRAKAYDNSGGVSTSTSKSVLVLSSAPVPTNCSE